MNPHPRRRGATALLTAAAVTLSLGPDAHAIMTGSSCQRWEHRPVDLTAVESAWRDRQEAAEQEQNLRTAARRVAPTIAQTEERERRAREGHAEWVRDSRREDGHATWWARDLQEWVRGRWSGCSPHDATRSTTRNRQARYYGRLVASQPYLRHEGSAQSWQMRTEGRVEARQEAARRECDIPDLPELPEGLDWGAGGLPYIPGCRDEPLQGNETQHGQARAR